MIILFVSSVISLHGIFAAPLSRIKISVCFFHIMSHGFDFPAVPNHTQTNQLIPSDLKQETHTGRNF